jgi:hypothetical protein
MATADAVYQRFQQERDAAAQAAKEQVLQTAGDPKRRKEADKAFK